MHVGVIGSGVAGLVTAKVLKSDGFDVTVFDGESTIGGVWAASRAYPGLRTNNPRETYVFSDFPHAASSDEFPTAGQVRDYLGAYVDHFGLRPHLRLATEVRSVARRVARDGRPETGFEVTVRSTDTGAESQIRDFDRLVVCNGVFSTPYVPELAGADRFTGSIIHSSQIVDPERLRGRRVVVVGAGKSALDCATFAGREAASCDLVFRKPHWMLPRYFGRLRVDRVMFSRLSELMLPAYHQMSRAEAIARRLGRPLSPLLELWRWGLSRRVARMCGMPGIMVPESRVHTEVETIGIGSDVYESCRGGSVRPRRASIASLSDRTVRLDTGEELDADLVVCATGWRQDVSLLADDLEHEVRPDGHFRLYRHLVPPTEPRLGFVGYASSSASPLTSEIAAHWLSQCFRGELALPEPEEMEASIDNVREWTAKSFPQRREGYFIGGYLAHYIDWLMRDMELATRRRGRLLSELVGPLWSERYAEVANERMRARQASSSDQRMAAAARVT